MLRFVRRHSIKRSYEISIDIVRRFFSRGKRNGGREEVQSSSLPVYLCEEEASKDCEVFKNVNLNNYCG